MRDLAAIVEVSALAMFNVPQDFAFCGPVRSKLVGHDYPGHVAQALQQLSKEALGSLLVAAALRQHNERVAVLINSSPEVVQFASDAHEHFIQKPFVTRSQPVLLEGFGLSRIVS
jgi:hypothetical protein